MKQAADFSDRELADGLLKKIHELAAHVPEVNFMEVCGTHTMAIARTGLRALLPENIRLLSGPGCPVCVTPAAVIDAAISLTFEHGATILTFGDMVRVPGRSNSLQQAKARGGSVEVVSNPLQAVSMATEHSDRAFVFIAVGFETTIPAVALAARKADRLKLKNLHFLVSHRLVPPALELLINDPELKLNGMIAPGHVSAILGEGVYAPMKSAGIPTVISGFEPLDLIGGIFMLLKMITENRFDLKNMYPRIVRPEGNREAVKLIFETFEPIDAHWRGIGALPKSGLKLKEQYMHLDAENRYRVVIDKDSDDPGCRCGSVLRGHMLPNECPLFGKACTPASPIGACMVSGEGSCAAYYKYSGVPA